MLGATPSSAVIDTGGHTLGHIAYHDAQDQHRLRRRHPVRPGLRPAVRGHGRADVGSAAQADRPPGRHHASTAPTNTPPRTPASPCRSTTRPVLEDRAAAVFAARERGEPTVPTTIGPGEGDQSVPARAPCCEALGSEARAGSEAFGDVRAAKDSFKGEHAVGNLERPERQRNHPHARSAAAPRGRLVSADLQGHADPGRPPASSTAIYFLLQADERSAWHKIDAVEVWHYYAGAPISLTLSTPDGQGATVHVLGPDLRAGARPQVVVLRRAGGRPPISRGWTLVGCTVAPGFDFEGLRAGAQGLAAPTPERRAVRRVALKPGGMGVPIIRTQNSLSSRKPRRGCPGPRDWADALRFTWSRLCASLRAGMTNWIQSSNGLRPRASGCRRRSADSWSCRRWWSCRSSRPAPNSAVQNALSTQHGQVGIGPSHDDRTGFPAWRRSARPVGWRIFCITSADIGVAAQAW